MHKRLSLTPLVLLTLAACGQAPLQREEGSDLIRRFGSVGVVRAQLTLSGEESEQVSAVGVFGALSEPQPMPPEAPANLGSCAVNSAPPTSSSLPTFSGSVTFLDAGEALRLERADGGPYARLEKTALEGSTLYLSPSSGDGVPASGPVPAGLTLTIPGASGGFPAFADVALPDAPSLKLVTPDLNRPVTADATFTWEAAPSAAGTTTLFTLQLVQASEGGTVSASCLLADTGSFALPEETRAELRRAGFTAATWVNVSRTASRVVRREDAAVRVSVSEVVSAFPEGGPL